MQCKSFFHFVSKNISSLDFLCTRKLNKSSTNNDALKNWTQTVSLHAWAFATCNEASFLWYGAYIAIFFFSKADNFCDFLFASLDSKILQERDLC